jgi:hypothetical protein
MSHFVSGILGTVAASLALGAVHLEIASGHDLLRPVQRGDARIYSSDQLANTATAMTVNRDGKSDRMAAPKNASGATLAFRIQSVNDTSILMRVPTDRLAKSQRSPVASQTSQQKSPNATRPVACEPPMSVLSTGAKQVGTARCLT